MMMQEPAKIVREVKITIKPRKKVKPTEAQRILFSKKDMRTKK